MDRKWIQPHNETRQLGRFQYQLAGWLLSALLFLMLGYSFFDPIPSNAQPRPVIEGALVDQEIRYHQPDAGEVFLVWGINGWAQVPEGQRPAGTMLHEAIMHTPMALAGNTFVLKVRVPAGASIEYIFHITKKSNGADVEVWDSNNDKSYHALAERDQIADIKTTLTLDQAEELPSRFGVGLNLIVAIALVLAMGVIFARLPRANSRPIGMVILSVLLVLGLVFRLWAAWNTNMHLPDTSARLAGDETGYDYLGYALLQGSFFEWPGRTPVYPLFLAACYLVFGHSYAMVLYVQAFIAALAIPLTYVLARRYTSQRSSLFAAGLVALHPALITQVTRLYTEAFYTPLLLVTLLALLWALEKPQARRFAVAGVILAIATLCRPATILMPAILPLLMPRGWSLARRAALCAVYGAAMAVVIAPWTYHNYRMYHSFIPLSVSTAVLWQGSPEFYHLMEQHYSLAKIWKTELNEERNGGYDPFSIEGDRYFNTRAIASIRAEPQIYVWYALQKLGYFWIGHPAGDWQGYPIFSFAALQTDFSSSEIAGIYVTRVLPLIALIALISLRRRLRELIPLLVVCGYFTCFYAITYAASRYSEPLHPVLAIIIAASASEVLHFFQTRHKSPDLAVQPT